MLDQCRKEKYCLFDFITAQLICRAFNFGKILLTLCLYRDEGLCSDEGTTMQLINASSLVLFAKCDQVDLVVFELVVYSTLIGVFPRVLRCSLAPKANTGWRELFWVKFLISQLSFWTRNTEYPIYPETKEHKKTARSIFVVNCLLATTKWLHHLRKVFKTMEQNIFYMARVWKKNLWIRYDMLIQLTMFFSKRLKERKQPWPRLSVSNTCFPRWFQFPRLH